MVYIGSLMEGVPLSVLFKSPLGLMELADYSQEYT